MKIKCIDASNKEGTGTGLLTEGKVYTYKSVHGGYYVMDCDDGREYTKAKVRFERVS